MQGKADIRCIPIVSLKILGRIIVLSLHKPFTSVVLLASQSFAFELRLGTFFVIVADYVVVVVVVVTVHKTTTELFVFFLHIIRVMEQYTPGRCSYRV